MPGAVAWAAGTWSALLDLVLPADCPGCDEPGAARGLCEPCAAALASATPRRVRPEPTPPGLPRCVALAAYAGTLRGALLAYKERGRHGLARPLGERLADVVAVAAGLRAPGAEAQGAAGPGARGPAGLVLLVPVPATAAAARGRYGDHMRRLAGHTAAALRRRGWPAAVAHPLRALPRPDSSGLSSADRLRVAAGSFDLYPGRLPALRSAAAAGARLVLVDDVVTTGATLAAVAGGLRAAGVDTPVAAVLAATRRRVPTA
jgi:predicted amidophosphoribosyltransferase